MPVTLKNDHLRAVIAPEAGVSVLAFDACRENSWHALMPDVRDNRGLLPGASFLMIPYSNRIENGEFTFQGKPYRLARGEQHAIHGDVRQRSWKTIESTATHLHCSLDSRECESVNWPWPFVAQAEYRLQERRLIAGLALWNRGSAAMPAGGGWHPYFNRTLTTPGEPVELCFRTTAVYPDANGTRIPSGPPQPLSAEQDFSSVKPLAPGHFLDTCFRGYDGNGYIAWPASGAGVRFAASPACSHLVLYNPADKPYFAVEPVTHANNGVNLLAQGDAGCGIVVLQPGECLKAWFALEVEWR